jgi:transcriptional regulator with PAS, ATPase and Fis domain
LRYDWPGKLRELARVIDQAHGHSRADIPLVTLEDLPASIRGQIAEECTPPTQPHVIRPFDELLTDVERRLLETSLRQARGNKSRAAELLGISRPRLYRCINELNLPDNEPHSPLVVG